MMLDFIFFACDKQESMQRYRPTDTRITDLSSNGHCLLIPSSTFNVCLKYGSSLLRMTTSIIYKPTRVELQLRRLHSDLFITHKIFVGLRPRIARPTYDFFIHFQTLPMTLMYVVNTNSRQLFNQFTYPYTNDHMASRRPIIYYIPAKRLGYTKS